MRWRNPFAQPRHYWNVSIALPMAAAEQAGEYFSDIAVATSSFEVDEARGLWTTELLCTQSPDKQELHRRLLLLCNLYGIDVPGMEITRLQQQDWLAQVAQNFPPMRVGRLFIHGSHDAAHIPRGTLPLQVDAGLAFGSGEHGTTRGCLTALNWLAQRRHYNNILDMGCGSGILAMAAAKLWKTQVMASDIDAVAVRVTRDNIRSNQLAAHITGCVSDGYANPAIRRTGPYDLIVSNILARPLVDLAPQVRQHLAPGGQVVLSGLLESQAQYVAQAYRQQHLVCIKRFVDDGWCSLVCSNR